MTMSRWSVSGLCVTTRPEDLATVREMLKERPGVEVAAGDAGGGRLVVTQEFATVREHQDGLRQIQSLPGVLTADLVIHYLDPGGPPDPQPTGGS
jgi:nitrate reductase NapAB chaperone NapD